jgi:hypothetical protein
MSGEMVVTSLTYIDGDYEIREAFLVPNISASLKATLITGFRLVERQNFLEEQVLNTEKNFMFLVETRIIMVSGLKSHTFTNFYVYLVPTS